MTDPHTSADWLVWQLADSAFPSGGFVHSSGLEAAWQHGEIRHGADLASFLDASLQQLGSSALPFVHASYRCPAQLPEHDRLCDAFTSNHVANRASRLQGSALFAAATRIFPSDNATARDSSRVAPSIRPAPEQVRADFQDPFMAKEWFARPPLGHYAPVFGAVLQHLAVPHRVAARLFVFNHLRSLTAAAVRLNIVGPMEAQRIQHRLAAQAQSVLVASESLTLRDIAQTAPLLDLWQGAHDRLHSRLFQS